MGYQPDLRETEDAPAAPMVIPGFALPLYHYQALEFKILEKLKAAVSNYGPTASFTLMFLGSSAEGWLTPGQFSWLAQGQLTDGDFVLWW